MQYTDNVKKWTRTSLEENTRMTDDRAVLRKEVFKAGGANVRTDDADYLK